MTPCRFFTDEDMHAAVAPSLRQAGFAATSTPEAGRLAEPDEEQLSWAAAQGRVLVTFNTGHFVALHTQWLQQGKHHAGIAVSTQTSVGDVLRRLLRLAAGDRQVKRAHLGVESGPTCVK